MIKDRRKEKKLPPPDDKWFKENKVAVESMLGQKIQIYPESDEYLHQNRNEAPLGVQNLSPDIPIHGDKFKVDSRGILDANKGKVDFKDLWED